MTGRIHLTLTLASRGEPRAARRWDVTNGMPDGVDGVWDTWRRYRAAAAPAGTVEVRLTLDGQHIGAWPANTVWPRATIPVLRWARQQIKDTKETIT